MRYLIIIICVMATLESSAQVGIGTTSPDASSVLDVTSSDKGILIPRMTAMERLSITTPIANGLLVYQTDDIEGFYFYDGISWDRMLKETKDAIPTGTIITFPVEIPPTGYLICNGSAVSRTTYSELFAIIGTMYGNGNGTTTFNLPDYRGKFLRGFDNGSGTDPDASTRLDRGDGTTGDAVGTIQENAISSHEHEIDAPSTVSSYDGGHDHSTYTPPTITNYTGDHRHTNFSIPLNINGGSHNHAILYENVRLSTSSFGTDRRLLANGTISGSMVTQVNTNHNHTLSTPSAYTSTDGSHAHYVTIPNGATSLSSTHSHDVDIPSFNSSSAGTAENRPVNVTVVWCIKY